MTHPTGTKHGVPALSDRGIVPRQRRYRRRIQGIHRLQPPNIRNTRFEQDGYRDNDRDVAWVFAAQGAATSPKSASNPGDAAMGAENQSPSINKRGPSAPRKRLLSSSKSTGVTLLTQALTAFSACAAHGNAGGDTEAAKPASGNDEEA